MSAPAHAPYAGGTQAFAIALKPLDQEPWIEADGQLGRYLVEKRRLIGSLREEVWNAEADTLAAQREVRDALVANLLTHPAGNWRRDGDDIVIAGVPDAVARVRVAADDPAPLLTASLLMQEDLCLMRRGEAGWRLAAGSVCFASSWSFKEKFGQSLDGLHGPVPGYQERLAVRMARIFDNLHVGRPVWRLNWSLYADDALHHPHAHGPIRFGVGEEAGDGDWLDNVHVRVERQTLTRMAQSGDILFTIRIHIDPLRALLTHPDRAQLAGGLAQQIAGLDEAQTAYKGLTRHRPQLQRLLERMASGEIGV